MGRDTRKTGCLEPLEINDDAFSHLSQPSVGAQRREYSGKFNVRVPKSLHAALASEAEAEGVSLNQLVAAKLALHLQVR